MGANHKSLRVLGKTACHAQLEGQLYNEIRLVYYIHTQHLYSFHMLTNWTVNKHAITARVLLCMFLHLNVQYTT